MIDRSYYLHIGEVIRILKRIVLLVLTMLSILFSATCFAHTMPESEMFLRGIGPKTTLAEVKTVYGGLQSFVQSIRQNLCGRYFTG